MSLECGCGATLCEICGRDINLEESTRAQLGGGDRLVHKDCLEDQKEGDR